MFQFDTNNVRNEGVYFSKADAFFLKVLGFPIGPNWHIVSNVFPSKSEGETFEQFLVYHVSVDHLRSIKARDADFAALPVVFAGAGGMRFAPVLKRFMNIMRKQLV